jgi:hypothetical protein
MSAKVIFLKQDHEIFARKNNQSNAYLWLFTNNKSLLLSVFIYIAFHWLYYTIFDYFLDIGFILYLSYILMSFLLWIYGKPGCLKQNKTLFSLYFLWIRTFFKLSRESWVVFKKLPVHVQWLFWKKILLKSFPRFFRISPASFRIIRQCRGVWKKVSDVQLLVKYTCTCCLYWDLQVIVGHWIGFF